MKLRDLGRPPTPFAGDDLVYVLIVRMAAHDKWLDHPAVTNGIGQLSQRILIEDAARLIGIGRDLFRRDCHGRTTGRVVGVIRVRIGLQIGHQGRKTATKATTFILAQLRISF